MRFHPLRCLSHPSPFTGWLVSLHLYVTSFKIIIFLGTPHLLLCIWRDAAFLVCWPGSFLAPCRFVGYEQHASKKCGLGCENCSQCPYLFNLIKQRRFRRLMINDSSLATYNVTSRPGHERVLHWIRLLMAMFYLHSSANATNANERRRVGRRPIALLLQEGGGLHSSGCQKSSWNTKLWYFPCWKCKENHQNGLPSFVYDTLVFLNDCLLWGEGVFAERSFMGCFATIERLTARRRKKLMKRSLHFLSYKLVFSLFYR